MPDYTPEQIDRLAKARARDLMTKAAHRADVHPAAAEDFVNEIGKHFEYDPAEDGLKLKKTAPAGTTVDAIIDAARERAPHRFIDSQPVQSEATIGGKFSGFAPDQKAGEDFFSRSPEEKIRIANERARPKGW